MRKIKIPEPPRDFDHRLVNILKAINDQFGMLDAGMGNISRGEKPSGGGSLPGQALADHHRLFNLATYDDHPQYAYLPGRPNGQTLHGTEPSAIIDNRWTEAGAFTSESSKAAVSTWSAIAIDTSAAVGDLIVLHLATAPFSNGINTTTSNHTSITDTQGNTWTKQAERTYSDAFGNGACQSVWTCRVTTALTAAVDTLECIYTGSTPAMAISSGRFLTSINGTLILAASASLGEESFVGPEPSELSLGPLQTGVQYLFFRASSKGQAGSTAIGSYNATGGHTAFVHTGSITAGGTGNIGSCGEFFIAALAGDSTNPQLGSAGGHFSSMMMAFAVVPAADGDLVLKSQDAYLAAEVDLHDSLVTISGDFIYFRDAGGQTDLSYIRGSDGAFVGPVEPTLLTVIDSAFHIIGSGDPTKIVVFEVDGLTTATTRTLTVPDVTGTIVVETGGGATTPQLDHNDLSNLASGDVHTQYLRLAGRTGGQVIGAGTHASASQASDLAIEGQLLIQHPPGANTAFVGSRALDIRYAPLANGVGFNYAISLSSSLTNGTLTGIDLVTTGTMSAGGSSLIRGFRFITTGTVGAGSTVTLALGGLFQNSMSTSGGTINRSLGLQVISLGDTAATTMSSGVQGLEIQVNQRGASMTDVQFLKLVGGQGTPSGAVTNLLGIDFGTSPWLDQTTIVNWIGIRIPDAPANPTGIIRGLHIGDIWSHHEGPFKFGAATTPVHFVDIAAGTTGIAPIKLTNGTNLTAAVAGAIEYDGSYLYITHGDAVRTKVVTQRGAVDATAQTAAIGATTLYTPPAAGYYLVHYTLSTTTADAGTPAVSVQFQVNYTDDIGATNQVGAALSLAATGRDRGVFQVYVASGAIQYQTNVVTIGTAQYALRVRVEALG